MRNVCWIVCMCPQKLALSSTKSLGFLATSSHTRLTTTFHAIVVVPWASLVPISSRWHTRHLERLPIESSLSHVRVSGDVSVEKLPRAVSPRVETSRNVREHEKHDSSNLQRSVVELCHSTLLDSRQSVTFVFRFPFV